MNQDRLSPEDTHDWMCPACGVSTNSYDEPLVGARAVALHVAGKIRSGDGTHRTWALNTIGDSISEPYANRSINTLSDILRPAVGEANRIRCEAEQERFERWLRERQQPTDLISHVRRLTEELEVFLHQFVRLVLENEFGPDEEGWWVQGIPLKIRCDCNNRREDSTDREEPYKYTYLIDLSIIIDKNWRHFQSCFQPFWESKASLTSSMAQLNTVRNKVAHPIRASASDEDLAFLEHLRDLVRNLPAMLQSH